MLSGFELYPRWVPLRNQLKIMSSKSLLTVLGNGVKRVLSSSLHASQSKKGSFYFIFKETALI